MTREELREKVAQLFCGGNNPCEACLKDADAAITIVLEEAAKVALDEKRYGTMSVSESLVRFSVSDAIRALGKD